jgi:hypothetical protein
MWSSETDKTIFNLCLYRGYERGEGVYTKQRAIRLTLYLSWLVVLSE